MTELTAPKRAYYKYEGPSSVSMPRDLSAGIEDEGTKNRIRMMAIERPQTVPSITLTPDGEYLLRAGEFPGLMNPSRQAKFGRLVKLKKEAPGLPAAAKPATGKTTTKAKASDKPAAKSTTTTAAKGDKE